MSKRIVFSILAILVCGTLAAQEAKVKDVAFKFYGRIRADLFYNSRASNESVDGLFYSYPKDHSYDANGNDLNASAQGGLYMLYTRLGVDITGPRLGNAKTSAKVEIDFRGSGSEFSVPRIRHAYFAIDWERSHVLVGQTWHPMFGEVFPSMLNLSTGSPFTPFNRSPLIRYRYTAPKLLEITAAAIWQQQYSSVGPDNKKSSSYLKNGCVPEFYIGVDFRCKNFVAGIGGEMLSLRPRKEVTLSESVTLGDETREVKNTYKLNERITSFSGEAHVKWTPGLWLLQAKTTLGSNLTHAQMLGGFAVTATDPITHECDYTPLMQSATWINVVYGKKWQPGLFVGYVKNLGTSKAITGDVWGTGVNVDQLLGVNLQISYNLPHWKFGIEYSPTTAWYGNLDKSNGRVYDTHAVTNHRVLGVAMFIF